jgi:hypothetical protein
LICTELIAGVTDAARLTTPFDIIVDTKVFPLADLSNVGCLEFMFKDKIAVPLLALNQCAAGLTSTSLLGMPDEVVEVIMRRCDQSTRGSLASVCERFWDIDARLRKLKDRDRGRQAARDKDKRENELSSLFL